MKLTFLGSGSAFTVGSNNYQSNMLLESENGNRLLIDCGSDIRFSLNEANLSHRDIHHVYISHLHADHSGGLEWLALNTKFDAICNEKPNLYVSELLISDLWNKVLSGGLSSLQTEVASLESYFKVHPIKQNGTFQWESLTLQTVQTVHIISGFMIMPSFGLMFTVNGFTVFITTDTQFCPYQIRDFYEKSDFIFHDCEIAQQKSHVHAHYDELITLPSHIKNKMWLYHYNSEELPDAEKDGFLGFVKKGQVFNF